MNGRVLIADQHAIFRHDLAFYVALLDGGYEVVGETGSATGLLARIAALRPHVLLIDIELPDTGGLALTRRISREWPQVKVLIIGNNPAADYRQAALDAGALEYIDKLELAETLPAALAAAARQAAAWTSQAGIAGEATDIQMVRLWILPDGTAVAMPSAPVPVDRAIARFRALVTWAQASIAVAAAALASCVASLRIGGKRQRVFTVWQYLHIVLALMCWQVVRMLQSARQAGAEEQGHSVIIIVGALLGIAVLEVRQLSRVARAAGR